MRRKPLPDWPRDRLFRMYVRGYVDQGYRVILRGPAAAIVLRPKRFSLLGLLFFHALYVVYYLAKRDERYRISLAPNGTLLETPL